jgi:hypothetical protein
LMVSACSLNMCMHVTMRGACAAVDMDSVHSCCPVCACRTFVCCTWRQSRCYVRSCFKRPATFQMSKGSSSLVVSMPGRHTRGRGFDPRRGDFRHFAPNTKGTSYKYTCPQYAFLRMTCFRCCTREDCREPQCFLGPLTTLHVRIWPHSSFGLAC